MFELGAVGLSTEVRELTGGRLASDHMTLVRLMRLLGPSVLRVGGDSVDFSWWTSRGEPAPHWASSTVTPADLTNLHRLLQVTGWRVLLGVDLGHFEPARVSDEARFARRILRADLLGIEIGNEPNSYNRQTKRLRSTTYGVSEYVREAQAYRQALSVAVPGVAIYGPALSQIQWLSQISASANMFTEITQHYYPAVKCPSGPSDATVQKPTVAEILSPTMRHEEDETLNTLAEVGALAGRPTRIGETGDGPCGGNSSGSPTFASALWSLDWTLRAASSGVKGLSFHGHLSTCGYDNQSPICAPNFRAANAGDVAPQSEYYGVLAARLLRGADSCQLV